MKASRLPYAKSYRDLVVYQKARQLTLDIFRVTATFPREEMFSLTDQIRRSSRSIGAQIAEAWAKRRYEKYFVSKLTDADGEQQETQHWLDTAADCGYLTQEETSALKEKCAEIGRLLAGMIAKAGLFCGTPDKAIRESAAGYFISDQQSVTSLTEY